MNNFIDKAILHSILKGFGVIFLFAVVSVSFFYPVLQDKQIEQSDIVQYTGMAKEQNDFRSQNGAEPYWTNSAFGGMPTFQLGAQFPNNLIKSLDRAIRFLPRPADYLFLYFLGFYLLLYSLKIDYKIAVLGALAYGFSTYFIIILGVGHNAKAHALGYMPMVLAGILWAFDKKYWLGFGVTALAMGLEIVANHVQMTFYFMLLVIILGIVFLWFAFKEKQLKSFFKTVGILLFAVLLGIGMNASMLLSTKEYADWSTRGPSPVTIAPDGSQKDLSSGLDKDYITYYSYGPLESLNLMIPRLTGGSFNESLGKESNTYEFLIAQGVSASNALDFSSNLPLYWGPQPPTSGPAYLGISVVALFFIGFLLYKNKLRWVFLIGALFTLMLSWGKFFMPLTDLMIDYFPLYDKFRAVSSIQVIVALCVPALASIGLNYLLVKKDLKELDKLKVIRLVAIVISVVLVLIFGVSFILDYQGNSDAQLAAMYGDALLEVIQKDRAFALRSDLIRSFLLLSLLLGGLWWGIKKHWNLLKTLALVSIVILIDLVGVAKRYVNADNFVSPRKVNQPFTANAIDKEILKDTTIYRVYDMSEGINGARTSYFHKSIGGYHAAKPSAIEDLFEFHIYQSHLEILHMLNVKYVIQPSETGTPSLAINQNANGNAWFVKELVGAKDHNDWLFGLNDLNTKSQASLLLSDLETFKENGLIQSNTINGAYVIGASKEDNLPNNSLNDQDIIPSINLISYSPNRMLYQSNHSDRGFAVFSEMHYPSGWTASIDGELVPIKKVNYALRGIEVPKGLHKIVFEYKPEVVYKGSSIALSSYVIFILLIGLGIYFRIKAKSIQ